MELVEKTPHPFISWALRILAGMNVGAALLWLWAGHWWWENGEELFQSIRFDDAWHMGRSCLEIVIPCFGFGVLLPILACGLFFCKNWARVAEMLASILWLMPGGYFAWSSFSVVTWSNINALAASILLFLVAPPIMALAICASKSARRACGRAVDRP